jgi:hypothetical protein
MMIMIRYLQPEAFGLFCEVYCFSRTKDRAAYDVGRPTSSIFCSSRCPGSISGPISFREQWFLLLFNPEKQISHIGQGQRLSSMICRCSGILTWGMLSGV